MPFTVTEFHDLIHILQTQPEWRMELLRVLFPDALVNLPRTLAALAEAQRQTEKTLNRVTERMERGFAEAAADRERIREAVQQGFAEAAADRKRIWETIAQLTERMERGFAEAAADRKAMRQDITTVQQDLGRLKGLSKEWYYRYRADAIFGTLLTAGQDVTQRVSQHLRAAQQQGRLSPEEYKSVLDADLLWSGKLWETGEEVILVLEVSWTVHTSDVERAAQRAEVLRRTGLKALPVAAGEEWPEGVEALARQKRVVITRDGRVDEASWQAALA